MNVVLVHGIFDNGAVLRPLARALERDGHRCWLPELRPIDGRTGIHDLAVKLGRYIDENIGADAEIAIAGFSMGCIVSRRYLQQLGGARRTKVFFAISGPHGGTLTAYMYFGQGARDMRPGSRLLRELRDTENVLNGLPIYAYWTSRDLTILPASSCCWELARETVDSRALLHRYVPGSEVVCSDIVRRLHAFHET